MSLPVRRDCHSPQRSASLCGSYQRRRTEVSEGYSVSDDFSTLLETYGRTAKQLEEKKETLDRQYQEETGLLQSRKEEASAAENQRQLCRKNQEQDEEMLKKQLDLAGFAPDADIKEACLSEETLAAMEEELHEFQETFPGQKSGCPIWKKRGKTRTFPRKNGQRRRKAPDRPTWRWNSSKKRKRSFLAR